MKESRSESDTPSEQPPVARLKRSRRRLSLAWLAPIAALVLTGVLGYQAYEQRGIEISITFSQAHGIAPDDGIVYRGVRVGTVRDVRLADDLAHVEVLADIRRDAEAIAREGSRFWIVRPTVSLREISGLDTLLGSRYIAVQPDVEATTVQSTFVGTDAAPDVAVAANDALILTLKASRRGSIVPGAPVTYRDMTVGRVRDYALAADATGVLITIAIDRRFAVLVHENTRFWNSSGIGIDFGLFRGLSVQTDSLESIVGGGIAFATPTARRMGARVADGHRFDLADEVDEDWLEWDPEITIPPAESP